MLTLHRGRPHRHNSLATLLIGVVAVRSPSFRLVLNTQLASNHAKLKVRPHVYACQRLLTPGRSDIASYRAIDSASKYPSCMWLLCVGQAGAGKSRSAPRRTARLQHMGASLHNPVVHIGNVLQLQVAASATQRGYRGRREGPRRARSLSSLQLAEDNRLL